MPTDCRERMHLLEAVTTKLGYKLMTENVCALKPKTHSLFKAGMMPDKIAHVTKFMPK